MSLSAGLAPCPGFCTLPVTSPPTEKDGQRGQQQAAPPVNRSSRISPRRGELEAQVGGKRLPAFWLNQNPKEPPAPPSCLWAPSPRSWRWMGSREGSQETGEEAGGEGGSGRAPVHLRVPRGLAVAPSALPGPALAQRRCSAPSSVLPRSISQHLAPAPPWPLLPPSSAAAFFWV